SPSTTPRPYTTLFRSIVDTERTFNRCQVGNGILCEHSQSIRGDQIRDTVVDFRINMVRTSCQNDTPLSVFIHPLQGFLSFAHDRSEEHTSELQSRFDL